jgi:hypothetical protein
VPPVRTTKGRRHEAHEAHEGGLTSAQRRRACTRVRTTGDVHAADCRRRSGWRQPFRALEQGELIGRASYSSTLLIQSGL